MTDLRTYSEPGIALHEVAEMTALTLKATISAVSLILKELVILRTEVHALRATVTPGSDAATEFCHRLEELRQAQVQFDGLLESLSSPPSGTRGFGV